MNERKIDVSAAANRLGLHPCTVYRLIKAGELQASKHGVKQGIRILLSSVKQFEERRRLES